MLRMVTHNSRIEGIHFIAIAKIFISEANDFRIKCTQKILYLNQLNLSGAYFSVCIERHLEKKTVTPHFSLKSLVIEIIVHPRRCEKMTMNVHFVFLQW